MIEQSRLTESKGAALTSSGPGKSRKDSPYRFIGIGQAITFWLLNRPADLRSPAMWRAMDQEISEFDPQVRILSIQSRDDLTNLDIWHKITLAIRDAMRYAPHPRAVAIFSAYWSLTRKQPGKRGRLKPRPTFEEMAREHSLSPRHVRRILRDMHDEIEGRLVKKGLMQPRDFDS